VGISAAGRELSDTVREGIRKIPDSVALDNNESRGGIRALLDIFNTLKKQKGPCEVDASCCEST